MLKMIQVIQTILLIYFEGYQYINLNIRVLVKSLNYNSPNRIYFTEKIIGII